MKEVADALKISSPNCSSAQIRSYGALTTEKQLRPGPVRHQAQDHLVYLVQKNSATLSELPIDTSLVPSAL